MDASLRLGASLWGQKLQNWKMTHNFWKLLKEVTENELYVHIPILSLHTWMFTYQVKPWGGYEDEIDMMDIYRFLLT